MANTITSDLKNILP